PRPPESSRNGEGNLLKHPRLVISPQRDGPWVASLVIEPHASSGRLSGCSAEQDELCRVSISIYEMRERSRGRRRCTGFERWRSGGDQIVSTFVITLSQSHHRYCPRTWRHSKYALERLGQGREKVAEISNDLTGCRNRARSAG